MHATSQLQNAVHWTPACLHLHLFIEEAAMQENDTMHRSIVEGGL